jgi:hypothetical protein
MRSEDLASYEALSKFASAWPQVRTDYRSIEPSGTAHGHAGGLGRRC